MNHPTHFFKYYSAETAKIVLATQKLRWNSPLNFNDPFDCYFSLEPKFDFGLTAIKFQERFFDLLCQTTEPAFDLRNPFAATAAKLWRITKGKSRSEVIALIGSDFNELLNPMEKISLLVRNGWKRRMADLRLFCVCEANDNLLLWSNYANKHTGVSMQFECLTELDVPLLEARQVTYSDEAPGMATEEEWISIALGLQPLPDGLEVWKRLVTTKARAWEPEKEWRVVTTRRHYERDGYEDCTFYPREISKIFLGCRISDADKADLLGLATGPFSHLEVYRANQNPKMFALDFIRIK